MYIFIHTIYIYTHTCTPTLASTHIRLSFDLSLCTISFFIIIFFTKPLCLPRTGELKTLQVTARLDWLGSAGENPSLLDQCLLSLAESGKSEIILLKYLKDRRFELPANYSMKNNINASVSIFLLT